MEKRTGLVIAALAAFIALGVFLWVRPSGGSRHDEPVLERPRATDAPGDGERCFARIQRATTAAPYESEEHVSLTVSGDTVTGTKRGTQRGPGMSNGFTGTLDGTRKDTELELLYSYVIEGSEGRELERYAFEGGALVKQRFPLEERAGTLVPDLSGTPESLTYVPEPCS